MERNASLFNRRMKHELAKIGYKDASMIPLAKVTTRLLWLMTNHLERVMAFTPAGMLKARKLGHHKD
jgi:hypothetical protein